MCIPDLGRNIKNVVMLTHRTQRKTKAMVVTIWSKSPYGHIFVISIGFLNMVDHTRNIFIFDIMIYSITIGVNLFSTCLYYNKFF